MGTLGVGLGVPFLFFQTVPQLVWLTCMTLVSGFALWRGGRPERLVSIANVAAWFLTPLAHQWLDPNWGVFAVDLAFLAVLLWLALTTDRTWLLFAAAFQLLGVVIHVAIAVDRSVMALAYMRGVVIWSYLVLASLGVGTWLYARQRRERPDGR